jgi:long-chain fatty acid transport protein
MKRSLLVFCVFCLTIAACGLDNVARASGIILYELGTPDVGRASAGWAARANDAATLFTNPAGMSRLTGQRLLVGSQLTYGQFGFKSNANTTVTGNDGGNPVGWVPSGSIFYARQLSSDWNVGIGAFSYFGLAAEYDQGWIGRYYVQKSGLIGFTLMPAVSFRANEHLSFGAGFNWMFGFFNQENAVRNVVQQTDGVFELNDNTQGFGANAGVLWEFNDEHRLGLTYVSQVKLDFSDVPEFTGLSPFMEAALERAGILGAEIDLGMTVPHMVMASTYHKLSDEWALMANVGWQNWNNFGKLQVSVGDTLLSTTTDLEYKDTWNAALGAEWNVAEQWQATGGIAYDSSPVDEENLTLEMPMGETWRFSVGGNWAVSERTRAGLAYQFTWMGSLPIDQFSRIGNQVINRVAGQYENTMLHAISVNVVWDI